MSLQRMKLGLYANSDAAMPNFSGFSCLEELYLSAYNVLRTEEEKALANLRAPALRILGLSFNKQDDYTDAPKGLLFQRTESTPLKSGPIETHLETWIHHFVLLKKLHYHAVKLDKVMIEFRPTDSPYRYRLRKSDTDESDSRYCRRNEVPAWPWKYLERARQVATEYDMTLEYFPSLNSRDRTGTGSSENLLRVQKPLQKKRLTRITELTRIKKLKTNGKQMRLE
jgi:hypothetical protein